jgi:hypothetical protein
MFLSVQLTNSLKIGLEGSENTRWFAVFLGPEAPVAGGVQASEQDPEREAASGKFIGNSCMMKRSLAIPSEGGKA